MNVLPSFRRLLAIGVLLRPVLLALALRSSPSLLAARARPSWASCFLRSLPSSVRPQPDASNISVAMSTRMVRFSRSAPGARAARLVSGDQAPRSGDRRSWPVEGSERRGGGSGLETPGERQ